MKIWMLVVWWIGQPTNPVIEHGYLVEENCVKAAAAVNVTRERAAYCKPLKLKDGDPD